MVKGKKAGKVEKAKKTKPVKSLSMSDQAESVLDIEGEIDAPEEAKETPPSVFQNGLFAANFVRPRFEKNKEQGHTIGFDISFNLLDEHEELVPKQILPRWREVAAGGVPRIDLNDIPLQVIDIAPYPEDGKPAGSKICLDGAVITRARIQEILSTGDGKETRNVRFSFTAYVDQDKENVTFAAWKHDSLIWVRMQDKQGSLDL